MNIVRPEGMYSERTARHVCPIAQMMAVCPGEGGKRTEREGKREEGRESKERKRTGQCELAWAKPSPCTPCTRKLTHPLLLMRQSAHVSHLPAWSRCPLANGAAAQPQGLIPQPLLLVSCRCAPGDYSPADPYASAQSVFLSVCKPTLRIHQHMANILTSPGVAAKRYWHSATRTAPWSGFVALTILLLSLLSACIIDTSYQDDLQAATGLFISALCILSMAFIPPKRCTSPTILGNLLPGPHLILFFVLCLWVFMYAPRNPPEHTLSLDAVTLAFATFIYQLFFATHGFPLSTRLGAFAMAMTVHTIHPLHSIGWREPFLIFVGSMTGILCGAAIVNDARVTRRMVKIANANRRADSRLNHVIKGQCGGAAALLAGIIETRQEQGEHVKVSDAELLESLVQIHRMLEQATEW